MKKLEKLTIEYIGYRDPEIEDEVDMEILGLESAIRGAQHRIAVLKQGVQLNKLLLKSSEESDAKTVKTPPPVSTAEQKS